MLFSSIIRYRPDQANSGQQSSTNINKQKCSAIPMVVIVKDGEDGNNGANLLSKSNISNENFDDVKVCNAVDNSSATENTAMISQRGKLVYVF